MDFMKVIETRQSIRKFAERDVPIEDLMDMAAVAGKAPSGKNIQNWHFVIIKNKAVMGKIAEAITARNELIVNEMKKVDEGKALRFEKFCRNFTVFFLKAPALVVVLTREYLPSGYPEVTLVKDAENEGASVNLESLGDVDAFLHNLKYEKNPGMQSLGAAIENFTLRAIDLGYGSCWLTSANYASEEIEKILKEETPIDRSLFDEGFFMGAMLAVGVPGEGNKSPTKKDVNDITTVVE